MSNNKTILIADDEAEILTLLEIELSSAGFNVIKATNGREALRKTKATLPDIILMDIMMPDIDGEQAVKLLNDDCSTNDIPIIFLTAMLKKEESKVGKLCIKIEGSYYRALVKPFDSQELLDEIDKALKKKGG